MPKLIKVFSWGLLISFLGCLPLGTLNITAMQIGIQESISKALYFAAGCLVVEMMYVRLSLVGINWVRRQQRIMKMLEWITLLIIILLAIGSFTAATTGSGTGKNAVLNNDTNRFLLGVLLSALNPLQVPFWFGWSSILFQKKILLPSAAFYNFYILGIGTGTLAGNCLFIFGGKYVAESLNQSQACLNWIIGCVFALTALIQLYRMLFKKSSFEKIGATGNS